MKMKSRRNKCVIVTSTAAAAAAAASAAGGGGGALPMAPAKQSPMPHDKFINRIRKSLYFGGSTMETDMQVSRPLAEYASELFSEPHKGHSLNRLTTIAAGSVHATPCSLIMALIYLDRLNVLDPGYARRITPQELFIVSMMISTKFYTGHDEEIFLSDWADDGDMTENRLKQLEIEFLCAIEWKIYISNEQFFAKLSSIEKILARREGLRRGWLTYTELKHMLPSFALAKFFLNNITVMAVSYAASVMTIAGAFFLASQIPGHALYRKPVATDTTSTDNLLSSDHLLPANSSSAAATDTATGAGTEAQSSNGTHPAFDAVTMAAAGPNATTHALNVEEELVKLEQQYREEALRDDIRTRRNEIASESRLTLPEGVPVVREHSNINVMVDNDARNTQRNWLALKEEFKDVGQGGTIANSSPQLSDCASRFDNDTSYIFWNLLTDAAQQSFIRLPMMWLKFI